MLRKKFIDKQRRLRLTTNTLLYFPIYCPNLANSLYLCIAYKRLTPTVFVFINMNEYLFYTTEGHTDAPNLNVPIENCQILGRVKANDTESAYKILFEENPWITKAKFNPCHIIGEQILTK